MSAAWIQCAPRSYGHAEGLGVGDAATADLAGRLEHDDSAGRATRRAGARPRCRRRRRRRRRHRRCPNAACRPKARVRCRASARRTERRPRAEGGGSGKERPAGQTFHRFQMLVAMAARTMPERRCSGKSFGRHPVEASAICAIKWIVRCPGAGACGLVSHGRRGYLCRVARRTMMLDAAIRALTQMFSPPFRAVLLKSVGFALVLIVLIGYRPASRSGLVCRRGRELGRKRARHQRAHATHDPCLDAVDRGRARHYRRRGIPDAGGDRTGRELLRRRDRARSRAQPIPRRADRRAAADVHGAAGRRRRPRCWRCWSISWPCRFYCSPDSAS